MLLLRADRTGIYDHAVNKVFCTCPACSGAPEQQRYFSLSAFEIHGGKAAAKQPRRSIKIQADGSTLMAWLETHYPKAPHRRRR